MISLRDVVTGFGNRDPLAEVWRRDLRGGGSAEIIGTFPISFSSRGKPLTDYLISGNAVQDGTPSSVAPVDVVGCGERSVNIMPSSIAKTITENGVTMTCDGLGRYEVSGTAGNGGSVLTLTLTSEFTIPVSVGKGGQGCMLLWNNIAVSASLATLYFMYKGSAIESWSLLIQNRQHNAYTSMGGKKCDAIRIVISGGKSAYFTFSPEFVETGSYPQEYEPYGYKLTPTVNGTEYPIYLGQVETTRWIKKLALTGEEDWRLWQSGQTDVERYYYKWGKIVPSDYGLICTHFRLIRGDGNFEHIRLGGNNLDDFIIFISKTIAPTVADFKSYLAAQYAAGTPVTVWYVLAEPDTSIVNEPLMKIGDYADTISFAQAEVVIPTVNGANVLDMTSPVKPSEVYIKGNGIKPTNDPNFENGG